MIESEGWGSPGNSIGFTRVKEENYAMIANELAINILNSAEEDQCTIHQIGPPLMTTFLGIAMNKSRYIDQMIMNLVNFFF